MARRPIDIAWEKACCDSRLTHLEFRVLVRIAQITNYSKWWKIRERDLARDLNSHQPTVNKALHKLKKLEYIVFSEDRKPRKAGGLRLADGLRLSRLYSKTIKPDSFRISPQPRSTPITTTNSTKKEVSYKKKEKELARKIARWGTRRASSPSYKTVEAYMKDVLPHIRRLGCERVLKIFKNETNNYHFWQTLLNV